MASRKKQNNAKLLQEITTMMTDPRQATNDTKLDEIMGKIRRMDIPSATDQLRLASCHFMTMYHTRKAMTLGMPQDGGGGPMGMMGGAPPGAPPALSMKGVEEFKQDQRRDMELGWDLLDIGDGSGGRDSPAARTARVLKIEVAQRLEHSEKLHSAFTELIRQRLTEEEVMVAFTAAPFLGAWKDMMKLGKRIEKTPGGLEQLHMMSLQLPIPDFTLIYQLMKEHKLNQRPQKPISSLKWELLNVDRIRVKFKDVECGKFEANRRELLTEIRKQGDVEWEDVPNCQHVHVKRMGSLCQAVSFGEIPMMLNGPWLENEIHVRGRAEMPLMPEGAQGGPGGMMGPGGMPMQGNMTILVQEEEWNLKQSPDNPKLFRGTYILKQRPELPDSQKVTAKHAPVNMSFDCEVFLGEGKPNLVGKSIESKDEKDDDEEAKDDEEEEPVIVPVEKIVTEFDGLELD